MKFSQSRAFTLIELLVVIAIIIVLAGMIFAVGPAVIDRGNKVQASSDLAQIVTATKAFYTDYGQYPLNTAQIRGAKDTVVGNPVGAIYHNEVLFNILRNVATGRSADDDNPGSLANPRGIVYIEPREVKDPSKPKSGVGSGKGNTTLGRWYDPWSNEYMVFLDADYDNQLSFYGIYPDPPAGSDGKPNFPRVGVGVASIGKDQTPGTKGGSGDYVGSDDIVSWR